MAEKCKNGPALRAQVPRGYLGLSQPQVGSPVSRLGKVDFSVVAACSGGGLSPKSSQHPKREVVLLLPLLGRGTEAGLPPVWWHLGSHLGTLALNFSTVLSKFPSSV